MARLGIDFGTTNTVAAIYDRGLFTVVLHKAQTAGGTIVQEVFPSAIVIDKATGRRWFGLEADRHFADLFSANDRIFIPSLKRHLRDYAEGKAAALTAAEEITGTEPSVGMAEILTEFLQALADSIRSSQSLAENEPLETVITWPANANGAQRYITRRCFRQAGFQVIDTLNEPTASAIELADCLIANDRKNKKNQPYAVAVFDLGGGTFDASVVWINGQNFQVLAAGGIEELGGDDFDRVLLEMFLEKIKLNPNEISPLTRYALLRQMRCQKESISTGAVKSLFLNPADFGMNGRSVTISTNDYRSRIRPMLKPAIAKLSEVIESAKSKQTMLHTNDLMIYLVGGSSKLPFVSEMICEAFPRSRVVLTDKPFQSVALGAAICAADRLTYRDIIARHFGLIRLKDHGRTEIFDIVFPAGTPLPRQGEPPIEKQVRYKPTHNIGHLRYLECTAIGADGMPADGVRAWSDILFPYDPAYSLSARVTKNDIVATDRFADLSVCEIYRCDSDGIITVEVQNPARHESRCYEIYQP